MIIVLLLAALCLGLVVALVFVAAGGMERLAQAEISHRHEVYELIEAQRREREQLLTRIQDPMLASANHAQEANGDGEGLRIPVPVRTANREPSIDEQERLKKAARVDAELRARGINPETLPG